MNTPNPLVPQGSIQSKGKSTVRIAFFTIAVVHVAFIGGLLMQGCKKSETQPPAEQTNFAPEILPFVDTNPPPTNVTPDVTAPPTTNVETTQPPVAPDIAAPPTVSPTPVPAPEPAAQEYVVTKGDSFYSIAKKFGVSMNAIAQANPGVNSSRLQIGQKLQIPAATAQAPAATTQSSSGNGDTTIYTVKSGDMLEKIARRHGTTTKAIMRLNNLKTTVIKVGQKLKLPASKSSTAEPVATPGYVTPLPGTNGSTTP
jgi:LysM repeat protein